MRTEFLVFESPEFGSAAFVTLLIMDGWSDLAFYAGPFSIDPILLHVPTILYLHIEMQPSNVQSAPGLSDLGKEEKFTFKLVEPLKSLPAATALCCCLPNSKHDH